jgi:hypothetical protein
MNADPLLSMVGCQPHSPIIKGMFGDWWAALDLPAHVVVEEDPPVPLGRHVSVYGATAEQVLSYIVATGRFETREGSTVEP